MSRPELPQSTAASPRSRHAAERRPRRFRSRSVQVRALLSVGILLGGGGVATLAAWSDNATATTTFSTGNVDLKLNNADPITIPAWSNLRPGSTQAVAIVVNNTGTLPVTYTLVGAGTGQLAPALTAAVYTGGTPSNPAGGTTSSCSGTAITATGTSAPSLVGTLIGTGRPLAGATVTPPVTPSETLCVLFTLPTTAASTLQSQSTNITLTFTATTT
ncbi:TasA family protein [Rathayibacter festucae]|uniref:TasA family protein n=1 Tax=Rathayibacter festucae TaxID=110937 RepID=UPI002A6AAAFA|nr:TasA family protein [Rathayibacter festucae]MDY0914861.1 TasA family protein [Rathayibacter festucae]